MSADLEKLVTSIVQEFADVTALHVGGPVRSPEGPPDVFAYHFCTPATCPINATASLAFSDAEIVGCTDIRHFVHVRFSLMMRDLWDFVRLTLTGRRLKLPHSEMKSEGPASRKRRPAQRSKQPTKQF